MPFSTPRNLIQQRFLALEKGDFGLVFDSYHPESPFLANFTSRAEYLSFAEQQLAQVKVVEWQILRERKTSAKSVEQILLMQFEVDGVTGFTCELAQLIATEQGWRYHSAQKMAQEDFPVPEEQLDFCHFDLLAEKIRF